MPLNFLLLYEYNSGIRTPAYESMLFILNNYIPCRQLPCQTITYFFIRERSNTNG